jgi:hypothetical protein
MNTKAFPPAIEKEIAEKLIREMSEHTRGRVSQVPCSQGVAIPGGVDRE